PGPDALPPPFIVGERLVRRDEGLAHAVLRVVAVAEHRYQHVAEQDRRVVSVQLLEGPLVPLLRTRDHFALVREGGGTTHGARLSAATAPSQPPWPSSPQKGPMRPTRHPHRPQISRYPRDLEPHEVTALRPVLGRPRASAASYRGHSGRTTRRSERRSAGPIDER